MLGDQTPRVFSIPEYHATSGPEAVELCRMARLFLDPWEEFVLVNALGERVDGRWSAFEVGLVVSRQNGKGAILEARELAGLFLLGERFIVHSAHQFDTSLEAFRRLLERIEDTPDFDRRVRRVSRSHGEEGIELKGGQRIRFRTRTKGGGRGFTGDLVILDEAMYLPDTTIAALMPSVSARSIDGNPQLWYTGSAVDQLSNGDGVTLARVRERGLTGTDPSLAYFEWSLDVATPDELGADAFSEPAWAKANPALGIRISTEHIANEQRSMDHRTFAVERLGVGDWPRTDGTAETVISLDKWDALIDTHSKALDPPWFAIDVAPDRSRASICVAAKRSDDNYHLEVVERRAGTGWITNRAVELKEANNPAAFVCDSVGPVASLVPELEQAGVQVTMLNSQEHAQACGFLLDAVNDDTVRHLGQPELRAAVKGAVSRPLGDAWAWSRKNSHVDISPLVACTLALWGISRVKEPLLAIAFA